LIKRHNHSVEWIRGAECVRIAFRVICDNASSLPF